MEHLSKSRCSRTWKLLCSHGLSDIMDDDVLSQLEEKHPKYKAPTQTQQQVKCQLHIWASPLNK
eukprot:638809-Ditylum_brightwellii.AAC.1